MHQSRLIVFRPFRRVNFVRLVFPLLTDDLTVCFVIRLQEVELDFRHTEDGRQTEHGQTDG